MTAKQIITRALFSLALAFALAFPASSTFAAPKKASTKAAKVAPTSALPVNIVATVNDDVISDYDFKARLKFIFFTSNIPDTAENRLHFGGQVLDGMVDELLKKQEAKKLGLTASPEEMTEAITNIESSNKLPAGALKKQFKEAGVSYDTFASQVEADLLWMKVTRMTLWNKIKVTDEEVQEKVRNYSENVDKTRHHISEIFLAVPTPDKDAEVYTSALHILDALEKGSSFESLARQFSTAPTAAEGGNAGWVSDDDLTKDLRTAINLLGAGQVSLPIKTPQGYYIILLKDRKLASTTTRFELAKASVPHSYSKAHPKFIKDTLLKQTTCPAFIAEGDKADADGSGSLGEVLFTSLPENIQTLIGKLKEGQISAPLALDEKQVFFMVCKDLTGKASAQTLTFDNAKMMLQNAQSNILSARRLRELKTSAIIEKRAAP